jgi:hypothetical protein
LGSLRLPTIRAAIDAADPGDVIHVASGTYAPADIGKPLTLIAEGEVTLDGGFFVGYTNNVNIYNFKIKMHAYFEQIWFHETNSFLYNRK